MAVEHVHTYLVHPGKGDAALRQIGGATVPLNAGKLFRLLDSIYSRADVECDIDILFNHSVAGVQENPCRELIVHYSND